MGNWIGWVLVFIGIGLSIACTVLFLDDATVNAIGQWIHEYQGLIGGFCALIAAFVGGGFMLHLHNRKINEDEKEFLRDIMSVCVDTRLLCRLILERQPVAEQGAKTLANIRDKRDLLNSGRIWQIDKKAGKISKTLFMELSREGLTVQDITDNLGYIRQRCTDLYDRLEKLVQK